MAVFSRVSSDRLLTCHADLQVVMRAAIAVSPIDFTIVCGHRGELAQTDAFSRGYSQVQWPDSRHNSRPSEAVDIAPYNPTTRMIDWEDWQGFYLLAGVVLGIAAEFGVRLRWGGNWRGRWPLPERDGTWFADLPHLELR